jgi:uncharacterized membrane protein YraQ (UPF0718 family)
MLRASVQRIITASSPVSETAPQPTDAPRRKPGLDIGLLTILVLAAAGAVVVFRRSGWDGVLHVLHQDTLLLLTIIPKVAAGALIGVLITLLLPRETILKWVGAESGLRGLLIAALAGTFLPGGPFTIFPMAAAFLVVGADRGAVIAFVTAWHVIGFNRALIWEVPFLGPEFVVLRTAICLAFPIIAGLLARLVPWPPAKAREAPK